MAKSKLTGLSEVYYMLQYVAESNRKCRHLFIDTMPGGRDTGNDFFVSQILGGSVTFPGTLIVG